MSEIEGTILDSEEEDALFEHHRIVVDKGQTPLRIDKFLMDRIRNATRNKIQHGIEAESVKVNDKPIKSSYKIKPSDVITVHLPEPPRDTEILPENIPLEIVYEDDQLLLVNKSPGMVVHPAHGNWTGTLVNALVYHFQHLPTTRNGEGRPGLVHRIDKDTSGLLVISKTEWAMTFLAQQFFDHSIERTYNALIWGVPKEPQGTIRTHLDRSPSDRRVILAYPDGSQGKHAVTHYKVLKSWQYVSLIECKLETGRTHQIRAHMKYLGHPIFSDETYGGAQILRGQSVGKYKQFVENCFKIMPRQALHAKTLGFIHPTTKKKLFFETEWPDDFRLVVEKWEKFQKDGEN